MLSAYAKSASVVLFGLSLLQATNAQTEQNITLCVISDNLGSSHFSTDSFYRTQLDWIFSTLSDENLAPWQVGNTTFNPIFEYVDSGWLEAGNGVGSPTGESARNREYDAFYARVDAKDPECDVWLSQITSGLSRDTRDVFFDPIERNDSHFRQPDTTTNADTVDKVLLSSLASNPNIFSSQEWPNFIGPYLSSQDQVATFMDIMWEKGARTVGFVIERDDGLDNVFQTVVASYLNSSSHNWVHLNNISNPVELLPTSSESGLVFRPSEDIYRPLIDEIYDKQNEYRRSAVDGSENNLIPDCIIISSSLSRESSIQTLEILHKLGLGADAMLWLNGLPFPNFASTTPDDVVRELYPGMVYPINYNNLYNEPADDEAAFLGNATYIQQSHGDFWERTLPSGARLDLSLSISRLNNIQTLRLAMRRANCRLITGSELTRCIRQGYTAPCSEISTDPTIVNTCNGFGADYLDIKTWFGPIRFPTTQMKADTFFARVNELSNPEGRTITEVQDIPLDIDTTGFPFREPLHPTGILRIAVGILCGLGVIGCLVGIIGVQVKSSVLIVRSAAPLFLQLLLAGSALMYASLFFLIFDNLDEWECTAWSWFLFVGWAMAFVSLLVKTHRVDQVFKSVTKTKLHDKRLLRNWWLPMVGAFVVFVAFFTAFDRIELVLRHDEGSEIWEECDLETPGMYVGFAMQGVILLWAAILAFKVRNAPSSFNEATLISVSVYNWLVVEIVSIVLLFILPADVNTQLIMLFLYTWLPLTIMLLMMFVPKIRAIHNGKGDIVSTMNTSRAASRVPSAAAHVNNASMSENAMGGGAAVNEVRKLRAEVGRLCNENTRITEVLMMIHNPHISGGDQLADDVLLEQKQKSMAMVSIHDPPPIAMPTHSAPEKKGDIDTIIDDETSADGAQSIDTLDV